MKAIKYLLIGVLVSAFGTPLAAQEDTKAVIEQIAKVIKSKASNTDSQVKELFKPYKKDVTVMVGIGRAYLDVKDTLNAQKYADMAMKRDKTCGAAYVLAGDIEVAKDNGGAAAAWFEQAVYFEPKNPEGYRRYAQINSKANPNLSVEMLERLREQRPDYPVDIISAEIYDRAGQIGKALEYYSKVDKAKMNEYQLANYATDYYLKGEFEKSLEVSQFANQKYPRNAGLNRVTFYNLTDLKRYDEAVKAADVFFNQSDSLKVTENDYLYKGHACLGVKDYPASLDAFQKVSEVNPENVDCIISAQKGIVKVYQGSEDYPNAIAAQEKYLTMAKKITATDYYELALLYVGMSETVPAEEKAEVVNKADAVYGQLAEKFPSAADFATVQRAHLAFTLDPESTEGLAKPHYEKLIEIIKSHSEKGERDDERLVEAYRYMGYYYLLHDDKANADIYWQKVLEIEPDHEGAKQALGISE
ncbi:MAG: tetratricopeptide repeat protein [Prevotella sp.]